jgi:threonine/homoserine/homoserine lactone efflux protein
VSSHFAALATLALAIFFSPETLVLGLIMASDKKVPRLAALAYAVGAVVGIAFATAIGLWIAHAAGTDSAADRHGTWPGFIVRVVLATALLIIGLRRAASAFGKKPIADPSDPEQKPSKVHTWFRGHFPGLMRQFDPKVDLPVRQRVLRAGLAGFAMCGLHPKVFPIAIAAGHQIVQITDPTERGLGIALFAAICVIPAVTPLVIDFVSPSATTRIKDGYERIMKVHGRWITAALLIGVALLIGHDAWEKFPARH